MNSLTELERDRDRAFLLSTKKKEKLKEVIDNPELFTQLAQEANDAWLEFKRKEVAFKNQLVLKQIGELYHG